jgi:hypothetical protein
MWLSRCVRVELNCDKSLDNGRWRTRVSKSGTRTHSVATVRANVTFAGVRRLQVSPEGTTVQRDSGALSHGALRWTMWRSSLVYPGTSGLWRVAASSPALPTNVMSRPGRVHKPGRDWTGPWKEALNISSSSTASRPSSSRAHAKQRSTEVYSSSSSPSLFSRQTDAALRLALHPSPEARLTAQPCFSYSSTVFFSIKYPTVRPSHPPPRAHISTRGKHLQKFTTTTPYTPQETTAN